MTKAPVSLWDLRRRIYVKAKAEPSWRFWGLFVHVCKRETLDQAYALAKANDGAPGIDGVTFAAIEAAGVEPFLEQLRAELVSRTYRPMRNRRKEIPKAGGKVRVLGIPTIRDRVVQGALKLILEPIFEADFQPGSFGYRPKRSAKQAVESVTAAIVRNKTRVIDVDLRAFFDNVRHDLLLSKVAKRVEDPDILSLLRLILAATGKKGVPQGGVISPLLSNLYLTEVDRMLEKAKTVTTDAFTHLEYARYADDLVILVDYHYRYDWLLAGADRRLREELAKLHVEVNEEKSRVATLGKGESFGFLGFEFRRVRTRAGKWRPYFAPKLKTRTALLRKIKAVFRRFRSQPLKQILEIINPILRGWVNYFRIGDSHKCFNYVRFWVERKVRRHLLRAMKRKGFGGKRWSSSWLHAHFGLFDDYRVIRFESLAKALPA